MGNGGRREVVPQESWIVEGVSLVRHTADIVKSYVSRNTLAPQEVARLIHAVYRSLSHLSTDHDHGRPISTHDPLNQPVDPAQQRWPFPAVPVEQAVTQDHIFCLICGKASRAIKGHLTKTHHIDVPAYRAHFGLPKDFPMVAPSYSETRRQLAVAAGSGAKLQAGRARKQKLRPT